MVIAIMLWWKFQIDDGGRSSRSRESKKSALIYCEVALYYRAVAPPLRQESWPLIGNRFLADLDRNPVAPRKTEHSWLGDIFRPLKSQR
jgi:hypothetical protein